MANPLWQGPPDSSPPKPDLRSNRGVEEQLHLIDVAIAKARFLVLELDQACLARQLNIITKPLADLNRKLIDAQHLNIDIDNLMTR